MGGFQWCNIWKVFVLTTPSKIFLLAISVRQLRLIVKFIGGIKLVEMLRAWTKFPLFLMWFIALMIRCH